MTIEQAMELIHGVEWRGSRPGLSRVRELLHRLGDPQDGLQFVHIAGTNGKGSTAAMLASILRAAGYMTGLFTSPYLERFAERMQVNGRREKKHRQTVDAVAASLILEGYLGTLH